MCNLIWFFILYDVLLGLLFIMSVVLFVAKIEIHFLHTSLI